MEKELSVAAKSSNSTVVLNFVQNFLKPFSVDEKFFNKINIVVDEIFSNIANYAYPNEEGQATVRCIIASGNFTIVFIDKGIQFSPVEKADPDVSLTAEERSIGGLGIFIVKNLCSDMEYEYKDNQNILKIHFTI